MGRILRRQAAILAVAWVLAAITRLVTGDAISAAHMMVQAYMVLQFTI